MCDTAVDCSILQGCSIMTLMTQCNYETYHLFTIKLAFSLFTFVYFKILCYSFVNWVSNL